MTSIWVFVLLVVSCLDPRASLKIVHCTVEQSNIINETLALVEKLVSTAATVADHPSSAHTDPFVLGRAEFHFKVSGQTGWRSINRRYESIRREIARPRNEGYARVSCFDYPDICIEVPGRPMLIAGRYGTAVIVVSSLLILARTPSIRGFGPD